MTTLPLTDTLDRELPAAAGGCQQSYGRIVLACQNTVTAIALAITRDVQASEDIAQEAFLKAWQQLDRLKNSASFLPWLRQITRNLARDWLRAQHGRPLSGEAAELAIGMAADPAPSPGERLLQTEEESVAAEIISALPEDSREALLLYYREGQRSQQVAALLGLSDAAVRKRLSRARASVRTELLQRFGEFARGSAPSAAFAVAISGALMVGAPATSAAAIIGASGIGTGVGKLGAGGLVGSTVNGGLAVGGFMGALANANIRYEIAIPAMVGGMLGSYLGGRYLLHFAENADERRQVRSFVRLSTATALLFSVCIMLLTVFTKGWLPLTLAATAGMAIINYQCLVPLQRIMAPMLARDAIRRGRKGPNLLYESMYGRSGVIFSSVCVATWVFYAMWVSGRL